jgi:hypothetical protein
LNTAKLIIIILLFLTSCKTSINKVDLIGNWYYTKVEYLNKSIQNPLPDISEQKPYFSFHQDGKAEIYSSGKILSQGTFTLENKIIRYVEVLEGGIKREIPFLVKELEGNHLVFETMDAQVKRITALR